MKFMKRHAGKLLIVSLLLIALLLALPAINLGGRGPRPRSRATAAKMNLSMAKHFLKQGDEREGREILEELVDEASDLPEGREAKEMLAKLKP